jgi:DNA (cytosine-5)-methyltransferase 1
MKQPAMISMCDKTGIMARPWACGHLFNGIGGFALAAHWMGWTNVMHCEIDPFCNKVMNHHFPNSYQHEDIRTTDFTIWRGKLDLITGGFPCQPYSTAGKRKGKDDDRHLWPQMLRAIREIRPGYVVGENVRGLTNWNGGLVFDEVQADLEVEGFKVLPFLLPACSVGAPHRRDRIWFVAHSNSNRINRRAEVSNRKAEDEQKRREMECEAAGHGAQRSFTNTSSKRLENGCAAEVNAKKGRQNEGRQSGEYTRNDWSIWPTQPPVCSRNDGLSLGLADWPVPTKSGTRLLTGKQTYGRWRKESIKALGNAVVPQVVYQIFKAIEQYEL